MKTIMKAMDATKGLEKVEIAAQAMGVSKFFLYRLAAQGQVPCYRAGKALRFDIVELRAWMKEQGEKRARNENSETVEPKQSK
jgi:excisionase family DNA binding protein